MQSTCAHNTVRNLSFFVTFFEGGGGEVEGGIVVLAAPLPPLLNLINAEKA